MSLSNPLLSIIIVNWNSWMHLDRCIQSILKHGRNIDFEVIVIDNDSKDDSVKKLKTAHPDVRLMAMNENLGFPKANNIGFKMARGKYILALNPDTKVHKDTLERSIKFLENNTDYGCVGVKTIKPNGRIQYECAGRFLTLKGALWEALLLDKLLPCFSFFTPPAMTEWDHDDERDVDRIQGAYMMFPYSVYEDIGGLDETLPMFMEDQEFCIRLWKSGYRIRYLAGVKITHFVGQSTKKAPPDWITHMRYESYYNIFELLYGQTSANAYVFLLLFILPLKLILTPFIAMGIFLTNRYNRLHILVGEVIHGYSWIFQKLKRLKLYD